MNSIPDGLKIQTIRQLRGLTQFDLSQVLNVSRVSVSYIENGRVDIKPDQRQAIEQFFGLRLADPLVDAAFAVLANTEAERPAVLNAIALLEAPANA